MTAADLRAWRERMGWSQERLALALEPPTTQTTVSRWETGERRIPPGLWLALGWLER